MAYYIGVMSGTSLDGVDLVLMDFGQALGRLIAADFVPMPENLRQKLTALLYAGETSLQQLGEIDHQLGLLYADCINQFLAKQQLKADDIVAIGCHGQTVWHAPEGKFPFTLQIGDMHLVAAKTEIQVIADFRRKDMAYGGQGAPLVPAFHQALFANDKHAIVVLNIGGISNISCLIPNQTVLGYDVGPGNTLLDQWIEKHQKQRYDKDGAWARTGQVHQALLVDLLDEPFFQLPAPKSTGRELFNLCWLEKKLQNHTALSPQDVQATLVEFTVQSIVNALTTIQTSLPRYLWVCGGGARNPLLMARLIDLLPQWHVDTTTAWGLNVDDVEAAAFAWLAYRRIQGLPSNLPSVTGAKSAVSLGVIFT